MKRLDYFEFKTLAERMFMHDEETIMNFFETDKPLGAALALVSVTWVSDNHCEQLKAIKCAYYCYSQQFEEQVKGEIIDPTSDQLITFEFTTLEMGKIAESWRIYCPFGKQPNMVPLKKNNATYTGEKQVEIAKQFVDLFVELMAL